MLTKSRYCLYYYLFGNISLEVNPESLSMSDCIETSSGRNFHLQPLSYALSLYPCIYYCICVTICLLLLIVIRKHRHTNIQTHKSEDSHTNESWVLIHLSEPKQNYHCKLITNITPLFYSLYLLLPFRY